jgi:hypothetical protein
MARPLHPLLLLAARATELELGRYVEYYILFFIHIGARRVHVAGMTPNPNGEWLAQQTRNRFRSTRCPPRRQAAFLTAEPQRRRVRKRSCSEGAAA